MCLRPDCLTSWEIVVNSVSTRREDSRENPSTGPSEASGGGMCEVKNHVCERKVSELHGKLSSTLF